MAKNGTLSINVMLSVFIPSVSLKLIILEYYYTDCHYAECHYADCLGTISILMDRRIKDDFSFYLVSTLATRL
jgi:hypothetical protein